MGTTLLVVASSACLARSGLEAGAAGCDNDASKFGFEIDAATWQATFSVDRTLEPPGPWSVTARRVVEPTSCGRGALEVTYDVPASTLPDYLTAIDVYSTTASIGAGTPFSMQLLLSDVPEGLLVQPYTLQGAAGDWTWDNSEYEVDALVAESWNEIGGVVPADAEIPLYQLGVQLLFAGASRGTFYVDQVDW